MLAAAAALFLVLTRRPAPPPRTTTVAAAEDTYLEDDKPTVDHASDPQLIASDVPGSRSTAYVKFEVPPLPEPGTIRSARLVTTSDKQQPVGLRLLFVTDTTWVAEELANAGPPQRGPVLGTATADGTTVAFDVTASVTAPGTQAFAIEATASDGSVTVFASEHGDDGPRLVITWTPADGPATNTAAAPAADGGYQPELMPSQGLGKPSAGPSAAAGIGAPPAAPRGRMLAGAALHVRAGETFAQAAARSDRSYGPMRMVRVFYPGLPPSWKGSRADVVARTTVVSFKASPREINAGRHDAVFANWFAGVPRDRDTYWVYYHEPEDNIAAGEFSAAEFRAAFRRLAGLAGRSGNPRLYPTLVLMCWSTNPASGRNWRDYYPGSDAVSVLGWDCYNDGAKKGVYDPANKVFGREIEASRSVGKPFGYAEVGSVIVAGDNGTGRAAWIRAAGAYMRSAGALWAAYFDYDLKGDFRLLDAPSQQAWGSVCRG